MKLGLNLTVVALASNAFAQGAGLSSTPEPPTDIAPTCQPACRAGYTCVSGNCVSDCNPPCEAGYLCLSGDCQRDQTPQPVVLANDPNTRYQPPGEGDDGEYRPHNRYFGVGFGYNFLLKSTDLSGTKPGYDVDAFGEVDIDWGGKYSASTIGFGFPKDAFALIVGARFQFPIQVRGRTFLEPQFGFLFNSWFADAGDLFQIALGPGVRLRYDVVENFAIFLQAFRLDILVLNYSSPEVDDSTRLAGTPVQMHTGAGAEIRY